MFSFEKAIKEAVKTFLEEIEPEVKAIKLEFEELRAAMVDLAKELADIAELFQRHLMASKISEEEIICRLRSIEVKFPFHPEITGKESQKTPSTTDESDPVKRIL